MGKDWIVRGLHHAEKNEVARRMRREMTAAEMALWQAVRGNKLDGLHFRRQQVIDGFVADFYCHAVNLIVEVDGEIHDTQIEEDTPPRTCFRTPWIARCASHERSNLESSLCLSYGNPNRFGKHRSIAMSHPFPRRGAEGAGG